MTNPKHPNTELIKTEAI